MLDEIFNQTGIPYRPGRFPTPPGDVFAVTSDDIDTDGADLEAPQIYRHNVTVELYAAKPASESEAALERAMNAQGLHWTKQDRYWIQQEKLYQTIYEFSYIEKRSEV